MYLRVIRRTRARKSGMRGTLFLISQEKVKTDARRKGIRARSTGRARQREKRADDMTHAQVREALEGVAGTAAKLGTGVEGDGRLEALATALATLTKCVQALTEHLDGQEHLIRSRPDLDETWERKMETGKMAGSPYQLSIMPFL